MMSNTMALPIETQRDNIHVLKIHLLIYALNVMFMFNHFEESFLLFDADNILRN